MSDASTNFSQLQVALRRIGRAIDLRSRYLIQRSGLSGPQLLVLRQLDTTGGLSVGELAQAVNLGQATITDIVDRLVKRGYVVKQKHPTDRRRAVLDVTPNGREILLRAPPFLDEEFIARFEKLAAWEQTLLLSSVQRLAELMTPSSEMRAELDEQHPVSAMEELSSVLRTSRL